jgi:hypothetical protein
MRRVQCSLAGGLPAGVSSWKLFFGGRDVGGQRLKGPTQIDPVQTVRAFRCRAPTEKRAYAYLSHNHLGRPVRKRT